MTSPHEFAAPTERPRLLVVAGPNGSGKTSVTEQGLRHEWFHGCLYINPDNLARDRFGDWNSPEAVLKAAQLAERMREEALATGSSVGFETVLGLKRIFGWRTKSPQPVACKWAENLAGKIYDP